MNALDEARAHLAKAREFLEAAEVTRDLQLHNAATSSAATAGINAKDAVCLALTGRTGKTENHQEASSELRATGVAGRELAPTLTRLLRLKPKSQCQSGSLSASEATKAVDWAERLVSGAAAVLAS